MHAKDQRESERDRERERMGVSREGRGKEEREEEGRIWVPLPIIESLNVVVVVPSNKRGSRLMFLFILLRIPAPQMSTAKRVVLPLLRYTTARLYGPRIYK